MKQKDSKFLQDRKRRLKQNHFFLKKMPNNFSKNPKSADFISQYRKLNTWCSSGNSVICQENANWGNTEMQ